jgi:hypothetical protein
MSEEMVGDNRLPELPKGVGFPYKVNGDTFGFSAPVGDLTP